MHFRKSWNRRTNKREMTMIEIKGAKFINPQHLKQEIADIVMGEITRAGYREHASWPSVGSTADSEETCAALRLADNIANEIITQYILIEPEEN